MAVTAQRQRGKQLYWGRVLVAYTFKNLPAMQDNQVQSLGWEDTLEKGMATHSQNSCLENSMDRGACRATIHGVPDRTEKPTLSKIKLLLI